MIYLADDFFDERVTQRPFVVDVFDAYNFEKVASPHCCSVILCTKKVENNS